LHTSDALPPRAPATADAEPRDTPSIAALTIGIDARAAVEVPAGRGRVVRELLRVLAAGGEDGARTGGAPAAGASAGDARYVLYTREPWDDPALAAAVRAGRLRWCAIDAREPWWHVRAARRANRECDVFFASNSYVTPQFLRIPCVALVHDLIAFDRAMRPNRRSRAIEQLTLGPTVRRAAALLVTTHATAELLAARYPRAAARIVLAPLGVSATLAKGGDTAALPAPGFVLAAGTLEPRKNLPRLVAAYRRLPQALRARHSLVVVGALGWETGATLQALDSLGAQAIRLGYVSDAELAELYRRCAVFCYPSLGEGFGLPVLEAMAAGAAVLTSNISSLPEVGGDAVAYADPYDVASIAAGLEGVLEDNNVRAELGRRARERAAEFSWEHFAGRVVATMRLAASGARSRDGGRSTLTK
jgi:glycosyltransferase involved in cell wall biosynthesis